MPPPGSKLTRQRSVTYGGRATRGPDRPLHLPLVQSRTGHVTERKACGLWFFLLTVDFSGFGMRDLTVKPVQVLVGVVLLVGCS